MPEQILSKRPARSTEQTLVASVTVIQLGKMRKGVRARLADLSGASLHHEAEALATLDDALTAAVLAVSGDES